VTVKPAPLAHHFHSLEQQRGTQLLGMWIFLATEFLIFGALWTGYAAYRFNYAPAFEAASRHLSVFLGTVNTVVLLASSLSMALAVRAARCGARTTLVACLLLTALLGATFLGIKAVEYWVDYQEKLVPGLAFEPQEWSQRGIDPRHVQLFLAFYYVMTGLHAVHLVIGIGLLLVMAVLARLGRFSAEQYVGVEMSGLYWHFVDVVWIYLFPLLYLVGTRTSIFQH
jgi:cytochrome c oxidase subunit III